MLKELNIGFSKGAQPTLRVAKMLSSEGLVKAPVIREQPIKSDSWQEKARKRSRSS